MPAKKRCPNEECGHAEYIDYSDMTYSPQPCCPKCMKEVREVQMTNDVEEETF